MQRHFFTLSLCLVLAVVPAFCEIREFMDSSFADSDGDEDVQITHQSQPSSSSSFSKSSTALDEDGDALSIQVKRNATHAPGTHASHSKDLTSATEAVPEARYFYRRGRWGRGRRYWGRRYWRRSWWPRYYWDENQEMDNSTAVTTTEPIKEITLRLPKHVLLHLIHRFGQTDLENSENTDKLVKHRHHRQHRISRTIRKLIRELVKLHSTEDNDKTMVVNI